MVKNSQNREVSGLVWQVMNMIRTTPVGSYDVFIYLLYISRLIKRQQNEDFISVYHRIINDCEDSSLCVIHRLFHQPVEDLYNNNLHTLCNIVNIFFNIEDDKYSEVFEELLSVISARNKYSSVYKQPNELTVLVHKMVGDSKYDSIYNPFAGTASYGVSLGDNASYSGQEITQEVWAIGFLRLLAHKIDPSNYTQGDSVLNWQAKHPDNQSLPLFDLIVATPPFGLRSNITFGSECETFNSSTTFEEYFIARGLYGLNSTGKLIGVFSPKVLYGNGLSRYIRQNTVSNDLLDTVITLPKNLFLSTSISTSILIFSKRKEHKGYVKMVDGSSLFAKNGKLNTLNIADIFDKIQRDVDMSSCLISNDDIVAKDYNITPALYVNNPLESIEIPVGYELRKLKEFVTKYCGPKSIEGKYRFVRGKDLAEGRFNFNMTFGEIEPELVSQRMSILDRDLLLVLKIGRLKPTLFSYKEGLEVCINPNIIALNIYQDKIHPEYLVNELSKEYVAKQVEMYSNGVAMQSLSLNSLLEIQILVPSSGNADYQAILDKERLEYNEQRRLELESENIQLKTERQKEFEKNMRTRRHAMNQVLNGLSSAVIMVADSVTDNHIGNHVVAHRTGETLANYMQRISSNVKKLEGMIENLLVENKYGVKSKECIEECIIQYQQTHLCGNYIIETLDWSYEEVVGINEQGIEEVVYIDQDGGGSDTKPGTYVEIAKSDLFQAFDNIIDNAKKYGFTDPDRKDYAIRFDIDLVDLPNDKLGVSISISNNGNHLSRGINSSNIFDWGKGNGSGIGAWQVKEIVEYYGGTVEFFQYPNDNFGVGYDMVLPYTPIEDPRLRTLIDEWNNKLKGYEQI